jgi:CBS domain containing-hemolysin-like protein
MSTDQIIICAVLGIVIILSIWFSLVLAGQEAAVVRVTRTELNNRSLKTQMDSQLTDFERTRKLKRIAQVQKLVASRNETASAASFWRIVMNVITGGCVSIIVAQFTEKLWIYLVCGLVAALLVGFLSILARPRMAGAARPLEMMIKHARMMTGVHAMTPFARISGLRRSYQREGDGNLSDDEEIERIHNEQSRAIVDRMIEGGDFDPAVAEMLRNVVSLSDTLTREIMVPRTDMVCIDEDQSVSQALKLFSRSGFSRLPIVGETLDDLVGIAYIKDAVNLVAMNPHDVSKPIKSLARKPLLVPESKPVDDLFHQMQQEHEHIAMVFDEYGGISGLVTIEDAIEQIVGELEDENEKTEKVEPVEVSPDVWNMPSRTPIADVEEIFEIDMDEDDVDTVYGLLTKILGHVPVVGESGQTHGLKLTAVGQSGRRKRVSMLRIEPVKSAVELTSNPIVTDEKEEANASQNEDVTTSLADHDKDQESSTQKASANNSAEERKQRD